MIRNRLPDVPVLLRSERKFVFIPVTQDRHPLSNAQSPDHSAEPESGEEPPAPDHRPDRDSGPARTDEPEQENSDLVNALGIVTIVFGVLKLLCGVLVSSGVAFYSSQVKEWLKDLEGVDPELTFSVMAIVILAIAVLFLILPGILQVVGGTGILKRQNWARILVIVLGGLDALLALPQLLGGNPVGFVISGGWGAFALYVLLSDPYQTEFYDR